MLCVPTTPALQRPVRYVQYPVPQRAAAPRRGGRGAAARGNLQTCIFAYNVFEKQPQSFVCRLNPENSASDICPGSVCLTVARLFSAQDARGTSSKLVLYGALLENTVEFVPEFAALQSHTVAHTSELW